MTFAAGSLPLKKNSDQELAVLNIFQWSLVEQDFCICRRSGFCARGVWFEIDKIYCLYLPQPLITIELCQLSTSSYLLPTSEIYSKLPRQHRAGRSGDIIIKSSETCI
jgi:hypothetical protein